MTAGRNGGTSKSLVTVHWEDWGFTSCSLCDRECYDEPLVTVEPKAFDGHSTKLCARCVRLVATFRIPQPTPAYLFPVDRMILEHVKKTGNVDLEPYDDVVIGPQVKYLEKRGLLRNRRASRPACAPSYVVTHAGRTALAVPPKAERRRKPPKDDGEL